MGKGKLYGVSVGPGDPELLTLRAARVLSEVDCIAAPAASGSSRTALAIIADHIGGKEIVDCPTPMVRDACATASAYDVIAEKLSRLLDAGKSVAFVTLGDASIYSTWSYVSARMRPRGYEIEVVAGVTSFCAAAARLAEPLCERSEQLLVVPAATGDIEGALGVSGTKVFMKSGHKLAELREALRKRGMAASSMLVVNCGLEGEDVVRDLQVQSELPDGMSIVIAKDTGVLSRASRPIACASTHEVFREIGEQVVGPDETVRRRSIDKWNAVAKPIGSLGVLEDEVNAIAALTGTLDVSIAKRAVVVFCADNGVVAQGVSQCGPEVTRSVAVSLGRGISSVCAMARMANVDVVPVDIGMADVQSAQSGVGDGSAQSVSGVLDRCVRRGSADISNGPAMTRNEAIAAIHVGIEQVRDLKGRGYKLIASGEMSIGNTTTSSAMAAVMLGLPAAQVTGRGAGLSDEGLARKLDAIERAIEVNAPDPADALDVLSKLGGLDIAGLAGLFIGGALYRVPVIIDGFISALAAYTAARLCPPCRYAMLASHVSAEPAARIVMEELGLQAPIQAGLRLGEGTGAVCLVPMLDMAISLYNGTTFDASGIESYDASLVEGREQS